jgi:hypothetical protein
LLRFEKPAQRDCPTLRLRINLFIFGSLSAHLGHFAGDFMRLFPSQKSGSIAPPQETKGLLQFLSKFCCRFRWGGTPTPYVHPIPPQPTPLDPMLRASAEGRNPKMQKPSRSRVVKQNLWTAEPCPELVERVPSAVTFQYGLYSWSAAALGCGRLSPGKLFRAPITPCCTAGRLRSSISQLSGRSQWPVQTKYEATLPPFLVCSNKNSATLCRWICSPALSA